METALFILVVMTFLAVFGVIAMVFGTDSREWLEDDWHHESRSRAQI
jgi:hypothetical protein